MIGLVTSCGRFDLLKQTLESLSKNQRSKLLLLIHEDGLSRIGQNKSIEEFLNSRKGKYYFHCEEDWEFNNSYDWIAESLRIMEEDPTIIKVICRQDYIHPCEFKNGFGILEQWIDPWKNNEWFGFGWNPGVTRMDLLTKFIPFPQWEQELSKKIHDAGYKVALLEKGVCKHIGDKRSTHEN
jgi:hypothetical protein